MTVPILGKRKELIVQFLTHHGCLTTTHIATLLQLSKADTQNVLQSLQGKEKYVRCTRIGTPLVGVWQLTDLARKKFPCTADNICNRFASHWICANSVGLQFFHAAQKRGDECGPLWWTHEVNHTWGNGRTLSTDLVLDYETAHPDGKWASDRYLVEVDRGTRSTQRLLDQLERYAQYYDSGAWDANRKDTPGPYNNWPRILTVCCDQPPETTEKKIRRLLQLAQRTSILSPEIGCHITSYSKLATHGPHSEIWHPIPSNPDNTPTRFDTRII